MSDTAHSRAEALFYQAVDATAAQDWAQAEAALRAALALAPDLAEAHANLAWLLDRAGQRHNALAHYQQALVLQPDNARVWANAGALHIECAQHEQALLAYQHCLALAPDMADAWCNQGALLAQLGQDAQAESSLRQALSLDAAHASAHFNLACLLLRQGRWEEGWQHLDARPWYDAMAAQLDCPRWTGAPLQGQNLLVLYEAGHGDVIQFCRYLSLLKPLGVVRLGLVCHPALQRLLLGLPGVDQVMALDQDWPRTGWDAWVPLLSLPRLFGTRVDHVPANLPYLSVPPQAQQAWAQRWLGNASPGCLRVGLVWQGNPRFENDAHRSLPDLALLQPLWSVPGVQFISLQKGTGEAQAVELEASLGKAHFWHLGAQLNDFADTEACLAQLDLVISVDTAVAHLAGALGRPCWVLLPAFLTDWRWLQQRTDSPWYPGVMRLFRQHQAQDWAPVVTALHDQLQALCEQRHVRPLRAEPSPD